MIAFFARHPTAANLLMLVLVVLGVMQLPQLKRETFPDITPKQVQVSVVYPGASAEEIEESVAQRIEDAVESVQFVKETVSDCREGIANVTVEMEEGAEFIVFKDDIATEVDAIDDFPAGAEDAVIKQLGTTDPVITVVVTGDMTITDLKAHCEQLKDQLLQLPDVSQIDLTGFSDHQLRVELSAEALKRFDLSVRAVADIVASQSADIPAGDIETSQQDMLIRFVEQRTSPRRLEDLVIRAGESGAEVTLGDIGKVVDVFEDDEVTTLLGSLDNAESSVSDEKSRSSATFQERRAGLLVVKKNKTDDVIRVASAVKKFVDAERKRTPSVNLTLSNDASKLVIDRLDLLVKNGWQGMVLVFFTMWLFFNWKLSFWVVMSLPVSFLGAFYLMPAMGLSVNMLTMVGMLLALGILMDDGIVIAENIASHRAGGKPAMQAAVDGVAEVAGGVFSSFLTTVCVLGPLCFLSGDIGTVLRVIPMMLILVLIVSLVEAFMILPSHLGHSLGHHADGDEEQNGGGSASRDSNEPQRNWFRRRVDSSVDYVRERIFGRFVDTCVHFRYLTIGCTVGLFIATLGLMAGGIVGFQPFPDLDGDVVKAKLVLPAGTPLRRTREIVERITSSLEGLNKEHAPQQPDEQNLVKTYVVEFNKNDDAFETGPHVCTVTVDLLSAEIRTTRIDDFIAEWKQRIGSPADALLLTISDDTFGPAGRPIEVRIQGRDPDQMKLASADTIAWFNQFRGVRNVADDLRVGKNEFRIRLKEGAFGLGLNTSSMASQVQAAFQGITADEVQVGSESYEIDVRLARDEKDDLADFDYFQFTLLDGKQVPLETVAHVEQARGWSRIARIDGGRTLTVRGDTDSRIVSGSALVARFQKEKMPELIEKYSGLGFNFEGATKETQTTAQSMATAAATGLIGVFVLLSFQFRSYVEPLLVMVAIPLALTGVFWGHWLMRLDVSMPSMMGFVSLAGIVVNDSLLLVLFLKQNLAEGKDPYQSAADASRARFRAIMLTSLTTIAGLLPLLFETSLQAQVLIPLAVSVSFGLMASTVLVLIVIPCLYALLADIGLIKSTIAGN